MFRSETPDPQSRDAFGIEAIELLGEQPHRLQPLDRQGALDQAEHRFAADSPHWPVTLWTQHPDEPLLLGIVRDEHERRRAATVPTLPRGPELRLVNRRRARIFDAVQ
jgi:hypothetical protein